MIPQSDVSILRELAKQVADLAACQENLEKRKGWYDINDLKTNALPQFIFHLWQISTPEIFPEICYSCKSVEGRKYELELMQRIFNFLVLKDDNVLEPVINYWPEYQLIPFPELPFLQHKNKDSEQGSYEIVPSIITYKDGEKLNCDPILKYDKEFSDLKLCEAKEIFEPILTVVKGPVQAAAKIIDEFSWLRGMEQSYMDMVEEPEWMHQCLQWITNNFIKRFKLLESAGLWGTTDLSTPLGSAGLMYISDMKDWRDEADPAHPSLSLADSWGFTCAELLTCCGNNQHDEFSFAYDKQVMSLFKYINVGCCEVLDKKIRLVSQLGNTRKISVSEWCDVNLAAEEIGSKYVYSYRSAGVPFIGNPWDTNASENEIRNVLLATRRNNCPLEIVMNIGGTFGQGDARQKAQEWSCLVRRLIQEIYG